MAPGCRCFDCLFGRRRIRVLMIGLDGSGKTSILYKLLTGVLVTTIPTVGYNLETVRHKNTSFEVWDAGGQQSIRAIWRMYYLKSRALIFVVDCNERERIKEAKSELDLALDNVDLGNAALLVMANKQVPSTDIHVQAAHFSLIHYPQDLPSAMSAADITEQLGLRSITNRKWHVHETCAPSGEGISDAFDWLVAAVRGN